MIGVVTNHNNIHLVKENTLTEYYTGIYRIKSLKIKMDLDKGRSSLK